MTGPVSLEEYAEAADRRIRELADRPMDLSELETAPYIPGTLHSAAPGDSISSIMGSSDPGAIGAFMQANDLNGTQIRAGQSYLVPERDSFAAPNVRALGQQGLNADNALATQQAQGRLDRSMAAIRDTMAGFDPLKGLLATRPNAARSNNDGIVPKAPPGVSVDQNIRRAHDIGNARSDMHNFVPPRPGASSPPSAARAMVDLFSKGKEMDYKKGGHDELYQDFGNFNYGAFGSALGFSPYILHSAAGLQQIKDGTWEPGFGVPFLWGNYGDSERDYKQIERGIAYYKNRGRR